MSQVSSQCLTLDIGTMFSVGDGCDRFDPVTWLNDGPGTYEPFFTLSMPLEVVDVTTNEPDRASQNIPSVSVMLTPAGDMTVQGTTPDVYVRDAFCASGRMMTSVDTLSRSIQLIDLDPTTVVEMVQSQTVSAVADRDALTHAVNRWRFDDFDEPTATQARTLLKDNVRRHEQEHVTHSINLQTALWKELELHCRWLLLAADPRIWNDMGFVGRFMSLYATPSKYITELLAILQEDYTAADPTVQRAVETRVTMHQGGAVGQLIDFFRSHDVDENALRDILHSPVGEKYCDLWLAYVINELRKGHSLATIETDTFLQTCDAAAALYNEQTIDTETRADFVALLDDMCLGPVVEVVCLTETDGSIILERTWCSMSSDTSDREQLLAVRRALFRRRFLSALRTETKLNEALATQEAAVEHVIQGTSLIDVALDGDMSLSTSELAKYGQPAHETARKDLLGSQSTPEHLDAWLNDPEYGFDPPHSDS